MYTNSGMFTGQELCVTSSRTEWGGRLSGSSLTYDSSHTEYAVKLTDREDAFNCI